MSQEQAPADTSQLAVGPDVSQNSLPATQSEFDSLLSQLKADGQQPTKWRRLIDLAQGSGETDKIKVTYEAFLAQYPNTAAAQISYIEHYINQPPPCQEAEELFKRWVKSAPSVELFRFYLTYIRRLHADPSRRDAHKRDTIRKAYDFALLPPNGIGQDKDSGDIWLDYIQFLSEAETTTTWDSQQNTDNLRKVYNRAVQIPLDNVDRLWSDYEAFETKQNRITAKKYMTDLSPAYMQARTVYRQLCIHVKTLYPSAVGTPELHIPTAPTFNAEDRIVIGKWKAYLKWEESNPLEIEDKDRASLITRIQTVYRKAVVRMRFYTEIWFMAYMWTKSVGKNDDALQILKNGRDANPLSPLLTFALIDALESSKQYPEVIAVFDEFLQRLRIDLEQKEEQVKSAAAVITPSETATTDASAQTPAEAAANPNRIIPPLDNPELNEKRIEYTLVYINYMRFMKRTHGVLEIRPVFRRARFDRFITWQAYEAAAMLEYHCCADEKEKKKVPANIFSSANTRFGTDVKFVVRYMEYLFKVDDEQNARALFESSTKTIPPELARPIWERWARYEYQYGDLEAATKLEKRMSEVYPIDQPIKRFAMRHMHGAIDPIASRDLGYAYYSKSRQGATSAGASGGELTRQDTTPNIPGGPNAQNGSGGGNGSGGNMNGHYGNGHGGGYNAGGGGGGGTKRGASPDHRTKREEHANKRVRPNSPGPARDRDNRDRYHEPPPPRRRYSPPPVARREREREREESNVPKPVQLPNVLNWFMTQLPPATGFDGPVFRTDDLMNLLRSAVIPSTSAMSRSPPRAANSGRPPPDYGPYQGPGGGRGRRY